MVKIDKAYKGFKITVSEPGMGRGFSEDAADLEEVKAFLDHYYEGKRGKDKEEPQESHKNISKARRMMGLFGEKE